MDFHFILGLVEDARWRTQIGADLLTAVAEEDITREALLSRLQRPNGAFREDVEPQAFRATRVSDHRR